MKKNRLFLKVAFIFLLISAIIQPSPGYSIDEKKEPVVFAVDDLKNGGYVIFFRHAKRDDTASQSELWELDRNNSCEPGGSLNQDGERESRLIAETMKALEIPWGEIFVSPTCRTKQMARILFDENFTILPELAPEWVKNSSKVLDAAALKDLLSRPVPQGTNRFLISHGKIMTDDLIGMNISIEQAEAAVFRPRVNTNGEAQFEFLGIIPFSSWTR